MNCSYPNKGNKVRKDSYESTAISEKRREIMAVALAVISERWEKHTFWLSHGDAY